MSPFFYLIARVRGDKKVPETDIMSHMVSLSDMALLLREYDCDYFLNHTPLFCRVNL